MLTLGEHLNAGDVVLVDGQGGDPSFDRGTFDRITDRNGLAFGGGAAGRDFLRFGAGIAQRIGEDGGGQGP